MVVDNVEVELHNVLSGAGSLATFLCVGLFLLMRVQRVIGKKKRMDRKVRNN